MARGSSSVMGLAAARAPCANKRKDGNLSHSLRPVGEHAQGAYPIVSRKNESDRQASISEGSFNMMSPLKIRNRVCKEFLLTCSLGVSTTSFVQQNAQRWGDLGAGSKGGVRHL